MSRSKRSFLFHKVVSSVLIRIPNLRKPIIPKLLLIKKFRIRIQKKKKKIKEFKLLRHYNNGFLGEYQWNHRKEGFKNRGYLDLCSLLCLKGIQDDDDNDEFVVVNDDLGNDDSGEEEEEEEELDETVDQRADRFIERFYEEMKLQRQESF